MSESGFGESFSLARVIFTAIVQSLRSYIAKACPKPRLHDLPRITTSVSTGWNVPVEFCSSTVQDRAEDGEVFPIIDSWVTSKLTGIAAIGGRTLGTVLTLVSRSLPPVSLLSAGRQTLLGLRRVPH